MASQSSSARGNGIASAVMAGVRDLRRRKVAQVRPVPEDVRIDGRTCLVTGASSGLGKAAAVELARRGGNMILACRPGHAEIPDEIRRLSGSETVELMEVDLADMASVHRFCDRLAQRGTHIDIALLNAGVMPRTARRTPQGYETMFAVHFLANRGLIDRWMQDGVIRPASHGGGVPRIVFITSEQHRSAAAMDFDHFGAYIDYGMKDGVRHYGASKLVQCTYATELSRRLNPGDRLEVVVHAMCPGGVATNIAREAGPLLKPVLDAVMRRLFQSPEQAIGPVIYLCCAEEAGSATGMYLHMMQRKSASPAAADPEIGARLWEASEPLVAKSRDPL